MTKNNINRLLTEREGRTREYLHEVITEYGPSAATTTTTTTLYSLLYSLHTFKYGKKELN